MKVTTVALSLSLSIITVLPVAAIEMSSSDRAAWIEQALSGNQAASGNLALSSHQTTLSGNRASATNTKKSSIIASSNATTQSSITSSSGSSLSHSVTGLFPGVRMRPFVPNRYLPSEHDIELAQEKAAAAQQQLQAQLQTQHQLQGNVSYTGGYTNTAPAVAPAVAPANNPPMLATRQIPQQATQQVSSARPRMISMQSRLNALAPSIPEPVTSNETIAQIRSSLKNVQGSQLIASASAGNNNGYSANLYPDLISPVPTQGSARNTNRSTPSPINFLSQHSTRQLGADKASRQANLPAAYTTSRRANLPAASLGGWKTQQSQGQQYAQGLTTGQPQQSKFSNLSYGGFQSYAGKVHVQGPSCDIASADCYSTSTAHVSSYAPYAGAQSSALPY